MPSPPAQSAPHAPAPKNHGCPRSLAFGDLGSHHSHGRRSILEAFLFLPLGWDRTNVHPTSLRPAPPPPPTELARAHRAAGPPFRLPHPRIARSAACRTRVAPRAAPASASRRQCCGRKRMIPAGRTSLSHARSSAVSSVPPSPTTSKLPAACRKLTVIRARLSLPCICSAGLQTGCRAGVPPAPRRH